MKVLKFFRMLLLMLKGEKMGKINFKNYGHQKNWISGSYVDSISTKKISVVSPYFDKEIATVTDSNIKDLNLAVEKSKSIFSTPPASCSA